MLYKVILSFESLWDEILRFVNPNESNWVVNLYWFLGCSRSFFYWRQRYCFVCHTKCLWLKRSLNKASLNRIRNSSAGVLCNCERAKVQSNRDSKNKTMLFFSLTWVESDSKIESNANILGAATPIFLCVCDTWPTVLGSYSVTCLLFWSTFIKEPVSPGNEGPIRSMTLTYD